MGQAMKHSVLTVPFFVFAACASLSPTASQTPFDMASGRPVVQVTMKDGSSVPFIFDTGAAGPSVGRDVAASLRMPVIGQSKVSSPHGGTPIEADIVDAGSFTLAGVPATDVQAVSSEALDAFVPGGAANVIGPASFARSVVEIDFGARVVRLLEQPLQEPAAWLPMAEDGLLTGLARVNGRAVPFTLDIGNPGGAVTSLSLAKVWNPGATWQVVGSMGPIGATRPLSLGALDADIEIAGIKAQLGVIGALDGGPDYLNLGSEAVKGLTIVIDNPRRRWGLVGSPSGPISMPSPQRTPA